MKTSWFFRFFPSSHYLARPFVGLDISDQSVKFIDLSNGRGKKIPARFGVVDIPAGVIGKGRILDKNKLKTILTDFRQKHRLSNVVVSLPEEQAFIVRMELPAIKKSELRGSIELSIEAYIPLKAEDLVFDYEILSRPKNKNDFYHLSVSVLPRQMVLDYQEVLMASGFKPLAFEIEGQAVARAIIANANFGTNLIVDVGKMRTGFAIVSQGVVVFTSTVVGIGGEDVTKSISKNLSVDRDEAEKLKTQKGLMRSAKNKELFYALVPVVSALADEIRRVDQYWQTHHDPHQKSKFDKIILTGGQATLPGLDDYLSVNLGLPVEVSNPWVNIIPSFDDIIPEIDFNNAQRYVTALGLALRSENNHG